MSDNDTQSPIDSCINRLRHDPLARILLENSHLSRIQFETFLIDVLWLGSEDASSEREVRGKSQRRRVSKGSFNRSLRQARGNVVKSVYTIFLLSYFGLFDSPKLEPFIRLGNEMQTFLDSKLETSQTPDLEAQVATKALRDALQIAAGELAGMAGFKKQRSIT